MKLLDIVGRVLALLLSIVLLVLALLSILTLLSKLQLYILSGDIAGAVGYSFMRVFIFSILLYLTYKLVKFSFERDTGSTSSNPLPAKKNITYYTDDQLNLDHICDQPWGFWVILKNKEDAHWALKVSGLLFFLMGGSCLLSILFVGLEDQNAIIVSAILALLAIFLVWSGIRMRYKKYSLFIPSAAIFLCAQALHILVAPLALSLIGTLQLILMLSALRAWFFLRKIS